MKIGIDARCLEEEKISGVGEYTLEIIQHLLEQDSPRSGGAGKKNQYIIFSNAHKEPNNNFSFLQKYPNVKLKRFRFPNKLLNFSLWYFNWPKLDKLCDGADVFFAPNINFLAVASPRTKSSFWNLLGNFFMQTFFGVDLVRGKSCQLIITFHDLSFERYPEFFSLKTRLWHYWFVNPRKTARRADRVIAVSNSTKKDLAEIYGIAPEKISIAYHGIGKDYKVISRNDPKLLEIQKKYDLPYKLILFLGNLEMRKNISALVEAYIRFRENNPEMEKYKLVLCGNVNQSLRGIIKTAQKSKFGSDIISTGYVDREDKPYIYNLASLFVYPSHFEGFGLPLLEAMACGTPVITSNNSSIPEVVEGAAILVNSGRPEELGEAMTNVLQDEKLYNTLRDRGLVQVQKFSWKKCAKNTLEIISKV